MAARERRPQMARMTDLPELPAAAFAKQDNGDDLAFYEPPRLVTHIDDDAVAALQTEREAAVRYATDPAAVQQSDLKKLAGRTDRALAKLRLGDRNTVADGADLPAGVAERLDAFVTGAEVIVDGGAMVRCFPHPAIEVPAARQ